MHSLRNRTYRLLRWSERYMKTDMVYATKGGFWLSVGHGIHIISGLILAIAFANLLPKEAYGVYQFVIAATVIISTCTLSGMSTAIMRAVVQNSTGVLRYGFRTQLMWSTSIVVISGAAALYYFIHDNTTLGTAFLIVGVCAPFLEGFSLYRSYLVGKQLFRENALLGLARRTLPIAVLLGTLALTDDPVMLIAAYFISNTAAAGLTYLLVVKRYDSESTPHIELTGYSKHLSVMNIFSTITHNIDKLLIFHFLGAAPLAVYVLAQLPVTHLRNVFGLIRTLAFPKIVQKSFQELKTVLPAKITLFFFIALPLAGAYILCAPFIFSLLFPQYMDAVLYSQVLVLLLLAVPRTLIMQTFTAHKMKRELYLLRISTPIVKGILLALLIPSYGLWGAVSAVLATELYLVVLQSILFVTARSAPSEEAAAPSAPTP